MKSREHLLNTVRNITRSFPKPAEGDWKIKLKNTSDHRESHPELLNGFLSAIAQTGGNAILFGSVQEWRSWFLKYVQENNPSKIIAALGKISPEFREVFGAWKDNRKLSILIQSPEDNNSDTDIRSKEFIADTDISVTFAWAGLADSGGVMIASQPGESRSASLLPPTHICLLHRADIYRNMEHLLPKLSELMHSIRPSSIVCIGGPSRTADIEKVLVTGVHGPKKFIVCIIP